MRSDQVTKDFIQSGLENLEARRLQNFSRLFVPVLDCPHGENESSYSQSGLTLFQLMLIASCPVAVHHCGEPDSLLTSFYVQTGCC